MATVINQRRREPQRLPPMLYEMLPPPLCLAIEAIIAEGHAADEIRLRTDRYASVTSAGKNIVIPIALGRAQMDGIVDALCDGSLYAHAATVNQGYITAAGGIRVGIAGRAAVEDGRVIGVYDVSALCFRLPKRVRRIGETVCELLRELTPDRGVLIYSPPAQGKTTLLRIVCAKLSAGDEPWRIAVVDTREELCFSLEDPQLCVDMLTGYPRALGLEIAARTMNAQLAVCDEIGGVEEAKAIVAAQNCGVPLLATAHASDIRSLLRRTGIAMLHKAGIFGAYVGISRRAEEGDYEYTVTPYEEADSYFSDIGSNTCGA